MNFKFLLFFPLCFLHSSLQAGDNKLIYDKEKDSKWTPITYMIDGTFDVAQNSYWFTQDDFSKKTDELFKRLDNPNDSIKKDGGYSKFFKDEFFSGRVAPNIFLHTLGGAHDNLWLFEYYQENGYPVPFAFATVTSYLARLGNEVLEVSEPQITSHDHIADLFIFDFAGIILSSNREAMLFLVDDLGMKSWNFQPMWDLEDDNFYNAGLNYIFRPKIAGIANISPFVFVGMQNLLGVSHIINSIHKISYGTGVFFTDPLKSKGKLVSAVFYENDDELLTSLFINGSEDFKWRLNLYPGLFRKRLNRHRLGILIAQNSIEKKFGKSLSFGININLPFGIGVN